MGIQSLQNPWLFRGALGIVALVSLISSYNYFFNDRYHKENNRAAGRFLSAHAQPDDLVICSASYTSSNLAYYSSLNSDLSFIGYPKNLAYVEPSQIEYDLKRVTADKNHFWLFLSRTHHSDPKGYLRKYCENHFLRDLELISNGLELIHYTRS